MTYRTGPSLIGVERHPDSLTLGQLALARHGTTHNGTAGQSFEFAVADAVNSGIPSVTEPIAMGLHELGIDTPPQSLRAIVTGIEGLAQNASNHLRETIQSLIPARASMRHGRPGRPMLRDAAVELLASQVAQWDTMSRSDIEGLPDFSGPWTDRHRNEAEARSAVSQLGRADVWIYTREYLVPAQLKINPGQVPPYGWRDVPLWIVAGHRFTFTSARSRPLLNQLPRVVVELGGSFQHDREFRWAVDAVDTVLGWVRAGRRTSTKFAPTAQMLWNLLKEFKNAPVSDAVRALHEAADKAVADLFGEVLLPVADQQVTVSVLDVPELTEAFEQEVRQSGLLVLHSQFWLPLTAAA